MTTTRQKTKQRLAGRETLTVVNPEYPSAALCEFLGNQGFDMIFIDCEHGGPGIERVVDMACAARASEAAAILRPWSKDPGLIRRYVDCRIDGLIVPDVECAEDVARVVQIVAEAGPIDPASMLTLALIESEKGIGNLKEILAVPGVDGMMVGPADFAISMGLPRFTDDPRVEAATMTAISTARSLGKSGGGPVNRYGEQAFLDAGGNVLMYSLGALLKRGMAASHAVLTTRR